MVSESESEKEGVRKKEWESECEKKSERNREDVRDWAWERESSRVSMRKRVRAKLKLGMKEQKEFEKKKERVGK